MAYRPPLSVFISTAIFAIVAIAATPALAVHDDMFELDGNILSTGTLPDPAVDWEDLFTAGSIATPPVPANPLPTGFGEPSFDRDFEVGGTGDDSYFAIKTKVFVETHS